ncbi:cytochrome P450 [Lactarius vividus]|nr:cytochrome P450 [Lactarius vividus]
MSVTYVTLPIVSNFIARITRAALPGVHFVEFFPHSEQIFQMDVRRRALQERFCFLFDSVRQKLGVDRPSLVRTLINDAEKYGLSDRENSWYGRGGNSVGSPGLVDVRNSHSSRKSTQVELDAVVGRSRTLTFADFQHLPYIYAMYNGMFIPKGTIAMTNVRDLNCDPEIYGTDAVDFNQARFLDANGGVFPKRVADDSLFIDLAMTLWACNIDDHGNIIPIERE